jgi:hypothetical protein
MAVIHMEIATIFSLSLPIKALLRNISRIGHHQVAEEISSNSGIVFSNSLKLLKPYIHFQGLKYLASRFSYTDLSSGHQDVKPASVLVLSYGADSALDWQFKLADFGLGNSTSKARLEGSAIAMESQGTRTYGV